MYKLIESSGLISVIGDFQSNYCILLFRNNTNNDEMMHLAEHYIIKMIYKKRRLSLYGRTDIDYMYLFFRIPESFPYFLLDDIIEICNTEISFAEFCDSKEEVLREIQLSNSQTLEILNFVSDGLIENLPVGNLEKIYESKCSDIQLFLKTKILNKFSLIYIGDLYNYPTINVCKNKGNVLNISSFPLFESYKFVSMYSNCNKLYIYFVFYYKSQDELDKYLLFKLIFFKYINIQQKFQIFEKPINKNNKLIYFMLDNVDDYPYLFKAIRSFSKNTFIYIKKNLLDEYDSIDYGSFGLNSLIEKVVMYKCYGDLDIKYFLDKEKIIAALKEFDFNQIDYFIRKIFDNKYRVIELKKLGD